MKILCDAMLGKLARDLRLLGYDAALATPTMSDSEVAAWAQREQRTLLTKDKALAAWSGGTLVPTGDEDEELTFALDALKLRPKRAAFLSRCSACGGKLAPAPETVGRSRCEACGHEYWRGTHTLRIESRLARFLVD